MNSLEHRYMGPTEYRRRKEDPELKKLYAHLIALGVFGAFAISFFLHTVVAPLTIDRFIQEAQAAEHLITEEEICTNLGRYTNGADYQDYCDGI